MDKGGHKHSQTLSANRPHESKSVNEAEFSMETNRPMAKLHAGRCHRQLKKRRKKKALLTHSFTVRLSPIAVLMFRHVEFILFGFQA